ncbi:hypothetical protein HHK36_010089 [Tetracentron sinense]|uniref:DNA-directed RNA polymerase III subunit RPC5 n=1 Tax=Tetracentron sinense TaxID=13715 RepID=A0A834ZBY8_TETSI|nr:hypothetical protein HHK36_010089 [Tetracentron sinense]
MVPMDTNILGILSWSAFKEALLSRFGSTEFEDPFGDRTKLRQTGSLRDYQSAFENSSNHTPVISQPLLVSCFISGLKDDIRLDVKSRRPFTLVAHRLGYIPEMGAELQVMVANGEKLKSHGLCKDLHFSIQQHTFTTDVYLLHFGGCDMVLGAQWLRTLSPILWDFENLWMRFQDSNSDITLQGETSPMAAITEASTVLKSLREGAPCAFLHMLFATETTEKQALPSDLLNVLHHFDDVFGTPSELPPRRSHDHQIPLLPGSQPTNVRPYRYLHFQKSEIEKVVTELLQTDSAFRALKDAMCSTTLNHSTLSVMPQILALTLSSSWKPPSTTGYAVGILMGNKLHLNPVHAVVQLRPSMEHLKSGGLKKKKSGTQEAEAIVKSEVINEKASVGPSKKQGKLAGISNEQNADDAESWVPLEYHGIYSDFSSRYREKMAAQESSPIQFSMSPYDYVDSLCPGTCTDSKRAKGPSRSFSYQLVSFSAVSNFVWLRFLLSLPLEERFKMWLCEGPQVHRFNALKHLAPDDSNEDVLGVLRQLAHLVQGLWVPKSSLLCQGVQALARDYVLFLFSKNPVINYIQLDGTKLPKEHLYRVLNLLAVERPSFKNWKFKEPTDVLFIKLHPDILREQERVWESHGKQITDAINGAGKSGPGMRNSVKPSMTNRPGPSVKPDQGAKRDVNGSGTMIMSDETQEVLRKALLKLFHTQKVCSFQLIRQSLRDMAVAKSNFPSADARAFVAAAHGVNTPQEDLQAVISEVAINVHGVYVSKSSSEHPEYDPFRKVVINLFCAKEPKAKLRKADIVEAAKIALKRNVPTNEYKKVLSELCVLNGGAWVLKSGDGNPK